MGMEPSAHPIWLYCSVRGERVWSSAKERMGDMGQVLRIILQGVGIIMCARFLWSGWTMGLVPWLAFAPSGLFTGRPRMSNRVL